MFTKGKGMPVVEKSIKLPVIRIEPPHKWQGIDWQELKHYSDLFFFLVWRDIKVLYAQTVLGFTWAVLNPLIQLVIFTIIFGRVAKIDTGDVPYALFSSVAVIPWTYMAGAMVASSQSLVSSQGMLGKVYFPRIIFPITPILSKLVDFAISLLLLIAILGYYGVSPTFQLLYIPIFIVMMMLIPVSVGLWLSSLAIRFRDVRFAMSFFISMLMYSAPIVYSAAAIPEEYRLIYSFNPIVGVIEGYRASLLGAEVPWQYIVPGMITTFVLLFGGVLYFRRMERVIVDVI